MEEIAQIQETSSDENAKRSRQNLLAIIILLSGLFLGSLFVDVVQLVTGEGFSPVAARTHSVLPMAGKTWVGYDEPKVSLTIVSDKNCPECDPTEALVWLRRVLPTLEATRVDINDSYGELLAERAGVVTLPAFLFSKDILHTSFYSQAASLFEPRDGQYFFDMGKIGLPMGRYLRLPDADSGDLLNGTPDAKLTIVEYTDFECPYCRTLHADLKRLSRSYGDQVRLVMKNLPLSIHPQAENAALAAECAREQGKLDMYTDYLFTKQAEWSKSTGLQKFKDYAWWLKLDSKTFFSCLDNGKYHDQIEQSKTEADNLGIHSTPTTFIGGALLDGAVSADTIKETIEHELAR